MGWGSRMPQEGAGWRKKWPHDYWVGTFRPTWGAETKLITTDHWFSLLYVSNGTVQTLQMVGFIILQVKEHMEVGEWSIWRGHEGPCPTHSCPGVFFIWMYPNIILNNKPVSIEKGFPEPVSCSSRPQLSLGIQGDGSKTYLSSVGIRIHGCSSPLYIIVWRSTQPRHIFLHTLKHVLTTHSPRYNVTPA